MTHLALSYKERSVLEELTLQVNRAREYRRAQALLWLDEGESVQEVAERLHVSRQSVYNWVLRFQARANCELLARVADGQRPGRPRTARGILDPLIDEIIESDPAEVGYRASVWTAPLLQHYVAAVHHLRVSTQSVRLAIERLGIRWKRPRHQLARRPESWRQAKGGSNGGSESGCGRSS